MTSRNVEYLKAHGPTLSEEMPNDKVSISDRENGVWKFSVHGRSEGSTSTDGTGGRVAPVYYLRDEHSRKEVVEKFIEGNQQLVNAKSRSGLREMLRRNGRKWHDSIDEVFPKPEESDVDA